MKNARIFHLLSSNCMPVKNIAPSVYAGVVYDCRTSLTMTITMRLLLKSVNGMLVVENSDCYKTVSFNQQDTTSGYNVCENLHEHCVHTYNFTHTLYECTI